MPSPLRAAAALASLALAARAQPGGVGGGSGLFNVAWPDDQPDGSDGYGLPNFAGAMPLGNGALTALAWANVSAGGVGIYLGHQRAQSTHTELLKLGLIQVALSPNPCAAAPGAGAGAGAAAPFFNQTADLSTGSVLVYCGGDSVAKSAALIRVWVDARTGSDTLFVDVSSPAGRAFSLSVRVSSTRPTDAQWVHADQFGTCGNVTSEPDVFVDPLPSPRALQRARPQSPAEAVRHASGRLRPLRAMRSLPRVGAFQPGSVLVYHRNDYSVASEFNFSLPDLLARQGVPQLVASTPDHWRDLQQGFALDGGDAGPALARVDARTLASVAPAAAFSLRATVLVVQTDTADEWLADLSALVAAAPPAAAARAATEEWWRGFWARSYIHVNASSFAAASREQRARAQAQAQARGAQAAVAATAAAALPVAGATLWLRASSLAGLADGAAVSSWANEGSAGSALSQAVAAKQPAFAKDGLGPGQHGVRFDGARTVLVDAAGAVNNESTVLAVFRDDGSDTECCSGVLYYVNAVGISTSNAQVASVDDDDNNSIPSGPLVVMADYGGSGFVGTTNVHGRLVSAAAVFNGAPRETTLFVDGCVQRHSTDFNGMNASAGVMVGSRGDEGNNRYFKGIVGEVITFDRALNASELALMQAYLKASWPSTPPKNSCASQPPKPPPDSDGWQVSYMYALTRYVQAIQSRGTWVPIKFNSLAFTAEHSSNGEADWRNWGASNWYQNTRLPYGTMLAAGDFEEFEVILSYTLNQLQLLGPRTMAYFNHSGYWTPETHHLSGAYDWHDYSECSDSHGPGGLPVWLPASGYIAVDQGGDSGTGEIALMVLDFLSATNDMARFAQYYPVAAAVADYFSQHYAGRLDGRAIVWPSQVLEAIWCWYDTGARNFSSNCCQDDTPTVSGMVTVFEKLLQLADVPGSPVTAEQRARWAAFSQIMPRIAVNETTGTIKFARVDQDVQSIGEGAELYPMHPHRVFTRGRQVASGQDLTLAITTFEKSLWTDPSTNSLWNTGWAYVVNAAALLGLTGKAAIGVIDRAHTGPASGLCVAPNARASSRSLLRATPASARRTSALISVLRPLSSSRPPTAASPASRPQCRTPGPLPTTSRI